MRCRYALSRAGCAVLACLALVSASFAQTQTRPNVLFIALDDLVPLSRAHVDDPGLLLRLLVPSSNARRALSNVLTPNINRLADRGVTFENAYTAYPLCNPSRTALLTGIAPTRSKYYDNQVLPFRSMGGALASAVTIPERFRLAGYRTLGIGKIFHFSSAQYGAGDRIVQDWPDVQRSWTSYIQAAGGTLSGMGSDDNVSSNILSLCIAESTPTVDQPDFMNADAAAALLRRGAVQTLDIRRKPASLELVPGQPFFLGVGIIRPHTPWAVPQEWLDRISPSILRHAKLDLRVERADLSDLRETRNGTKRKMKALFGYNGSDRTAARARKRLLSAIRYYLASVAFADACVGRVLDALAASPYANDTTVVLFSDHGYAVGQKLHVGKNSLWEASVRSEFIIADPRRTKPAESIRKPVSLLDIYPTICQLATVDTTGYILDGENLAPAVLGQGSAPERAVLIAHNKHEYAIRKGAWKLIVRKNSPAGDELYNIEEDPLERKNLLYKGGSPFATGVAFELRNEVPKRMRP